MTNVVDFPRSPSERLGLTPEDTAEADDVEGMLVEGVGDPTTGAYDTEDMVALLLLLVVQLRRRVTALEERLQQKEG